MASANQDPKNSRPSLAVKTAVVLLGMSALLNLYSTQPVLVDIADWAHITSTDAAWTISTSTLGVAVTAPFAGFISDRLGRKRIILIAFALMSAMTFACLLAPNFGVCFS